VYFARILILNEFKLRKFCLFLQEWRFGRSRSTEVIDFGANRKRICNFLLVRNSNLGPILHHFGDMTAFVCSWSHFSYTVILGRSRCTRSLTCGVSQRINLKLFGREIIFEKFQPTWARHPVPEVRHRQTDRQTDTQTLYCGTTALCIASRAKKKTLYHEFEFMICRPTYDSFCVLLVPPFFYKIITLSLRWPRDAPHMWVPWKLYRPE